MPIEHPQLNFGLFQVSHVECVSQAEAQDFVEDDTTHGWTSARRRLLYGLFQCYFVENMKLCSNCAFELFQLLVEHVVEPVWTGMRTTTGWFLFY